TSGHTWLTYEYTTLPLLYDLMIDETLQRVFEYDGSTHNLKTIDVDNLYGMANFEGDEAGRNVVTQGYDLEGGSSVYHYNSTNMWAPQHSYRTSPTATLKVTPHDVDITVTGERLYGQHNLLGYFVYVPAHGIEKDKFFFVDTSTTDGKYIDFADIDKELPQTATPAEQQPLQELKEKIQAALVDLGLDSDFYSKDDPAKLFKAAVNKNGNYLVTIGYETNIKSLVAGETVDDVLQGFLEKVGTDQKGMDFYDTDIDLQGKGAGTNTLNTGKYKDTIKGIDNTGANYFYTSGKAISKDDVKFDENGRPYTMKTESGGTSTEKIYLDTYTSCNYDLSYLGSLKINKADLYYTYDGVKTYGDDNNTQTSGKITIVGADKDLKEADGFTPGSANTSVNGYLKDWDSDKVGADGKIDITGSKKTNNTVLAVVAGKTAVAHKDDVNNTLYYTINGIDNLYLYIDNTSGTVYKYDYDNHSILKDAKGAYVKYDVTKADSVIQKVINPTGTDNVQDRIYHVKTKVVDQETGEKVVDTYQVLWTNIKPNNVSALSKNYNFVFVGEGEHQTTYTKAATTYAEREKVVVNKGEGQAAKNYTDTLYELNTSITAGKSTQKINPKDLEVTIIGQRDYGTNMITTKYKTNGTTGLVDNYWYTQTDTEDKELEKWDKLKEKTVLDIIKGIETDKNSKTQISPYTNTRIKENDNNGYDLLKPSDTPDPYNGNVYSESAIDVTTKENTTRKFTILEDVNADDYIVSNGNHKLTIKPAELVVTIDGGKTYGGETKTTSKDYDIKGTGFANGENFSEDDLNNITVKVTDDLNDTKLNAGTYEADIDNKGAVTNNIYTPIKGTPASTTAYVKGLDEEAINGFNVDNYIISYDTTYNVEQAKATITSSATKIYGDGLTKKEVEYDYDGFVFDEGEKLGPKSELDKSLKITDPTKYNVGTYGTLGETEPKVPVLNLVDNKATIEDLYGNNYDITFQDELIITPRDLEITIKAQKEFSTGPEHTNWYDNTGKLHDEYYSNPSKENVAQLNNNKDWDKDKFNGIVAENITDKTTYDDQKDSMDINQTDSVFEIGKMKVDLSNVDDQTRKNYNIKINTEVIITPTVLEYYGIEEEIYIGQPIPNVKPGQGDINPETGHPAGVYNHFGEEVSEAIDANWPTDGRVNNLQIGTYAVQPLSDDKMPGTPKWKFDPAKSYDAHVIVKPNPRDPEVSSLSPGQAQHNRRQMISIQYLNLVG
ncbi:MAG: hypothetical protein HUJ56_13080, partial [Erysipelotrichaceae bacterium]|nr:hypothetical protein [Erysipelotrichaceae bacterium]